VLAGEPIAEGQLQHLEIVDERTGKVKTIAGVTSQ